jgi:ornithine cyclodeaminase/alanine dehydrogenase-like protein (mu-crystallin family)
MSDLLKIEVIGVDEPGKAVFGSDIVVTSGPIMKHPKPTIVKEWLSPGLFSSSVDYGSYWMPDCLAQFDKMSTDDLPQYHFYESIGYFDGFPEPYTDLGKLVSGACPGRERSEECTIAINLGLALSDLAIAPAIYKRAIERGLGTMLSL